MPVSWTVLVVGNMLAICSGFPCVFKSKLTWIFLQSENKSRFGSVLHIFYGFPVLRKSGILLLIFYKFLQMKHKFAQTRHNLYVLQRYN